MYRSLYAADDRRTSKYHKHKDASTIEWKGGTNTRVRDNGLTSHVLYEDYQDTHCQGHSDTCVGCCMQLPKNTKRKSHKHIGLTEKLGSRRRRAASLAARISGSMGGRLWMGVLQMSQIRLPLTCSEEAHAGCKLSL